MIMGFNDLMEQFEIECQFGCWIGESIEFHSDNISDITLSAHVLIYIYIYVEIELEL